MRRDLFRSVRSTSGRTMPRLRAGVLLIVAATGFVSASCTTGQMAGESAAYVIIDQLQAASGARPGEFSNTLASDVQTSLGILEDAGRIVVRLALKDPGSQDSPNQPSSSNFITLTRYRVEYVRSDGRNTPGVHVPYPFDGAMTITAIPAGAAGTFVLVRVQSKLEAPLMALRDLGGAVAISTLANVTFYGHDQAGRDVSVTGQISVNFADWADPQ